ncbi:MAG TPA: hypothetical protein VJ697_11855 [Nitrososphaeraceae archaeon]|nr:hypothetical protein [Nitrososphaeraceae archaeon]
MKIKSLGLMLTVIGLLLMLQTTSAYDPHEYNYEYVHCGNGVWYPENTDCEVALKQYYGERYNDEVGWQKQYQYQLQVKQEEEEAENNNNNDCLSEPDDNFYCKEFDWSAFYPDRQIVDKLCDVNEDYAKNPKNCDKAYDLVKEDEEGPEKKYCENSWKWDDDKKECKINDEEERTFYEDAVCDSEDADTTNVKMCMSDKREQQIKNIENVCDEVGGKMKKDGCHTDHDGPMADEFERKITEIDQEEVKPTLLVPDSLEGTLTEEQKEALSKENPDWEFKSDVNIPNSLEGKLTQEQMETLSEENYDIEYQWEDTASNPVPGTPSYVGPEEEKRYVNPDGGAPLYEDELTEDEKDYYEEYKPEKEQKQMEDGGNTVTYEEEQIQNELKEITPEEAEEMNEQNEVSEQ